MKTPIKVVVNRVKKDKIHHEYTKIAQIDSSYRTTSQNELKRIYVFLKGNTKGLTGFIEPLRKQEYKTVKKNITRWYFDMDEVWEKLQRDTYFKKVLTNMRINSPEELSFRVMQQDISVY